MKLLIFSQSQRRALNLETPEEAAGKAPPIRTELGNFAWQSHGRDLFQIPMAA